jgi:hypothetical protein
MQRIQTTLFYGPTSQRIFIEQTSCVALLQTHVTVPAMIQSKKWPANRSSCLCLDLFGVHCCQISQLLCYWYQNILTNKFSQFEMPRSRYPICSQKRLQNNLVDYICRNINMYVWPIYFSCCIWYWYADSFLPS